MSRQVVTLSLETDTVRLTILKGDRVDWWGRTPLDASLVENNPEEIGQQVRGLMQSMQIASSQVITDLAHPAVLFRNLQLPKMASRYIPQVVTSEVKETIPFSLDEVELSWQAFPRDGGWQVLAFCIPTDVVDNQVRVLKAAGINPTVIYPKSLVLAHAVGEQNAIVLNLEPGRTDITLVLQGLPRVSYQSPTNLDTGNRQEALQTLSAEVERTVTFHQSAESGDLDNLAVIPIGKLADDELVAALAQASQREVRSLKSPFDCPSDFPASEYAVNLGLAVAARQHGGVALPSINVLPVRYRPKPFPWRPAFVFAGVLLMAVAAFVLGQALAEKAASVTSLSSQVDSLQAQMSQRRLQLLEVGNLQQEVEEIEGFSQQLDTHLEELAATRSSLIQRLETAAVSAIPAGVALNSANYGAEQLSLQGQAPSYTQALLYAKQLRESGLFHEVHLIQAQGMGEGITFQIIATYLQNGTRAPPQD